MEANDLVQLLLVDGVRPSQAGPVLERANETIPFFLRQSDLDGGCAAHCVLMALIALGKVTRGEIATLRQNLRSHPMKNAWSWIVRDYFVGVDTGELRQLVHFFKGDLCCSFTDAKGSRTGRWITDFLRQGCFVIVGIESSRNILDHWTLAIGHMSAPREGSRFLLLDPSSDAPKGQCWNSVFLEPADGRSGVFLDGLGKQFPARLSGAVAIFPKAWAVGRTSTIKAVHHG